MSGLSHLEFRAVGGQQPFDAAALERFVAAPRIAILAYSRADGRPAQTPIWYVYRDGSFYMVTGANSAKAKALARDPRVCLTIQDEAAPYRAAIFDGMSISRRYHPIRRPPASRRATSAASAAPSTRR